ncbi:peptidase C54 [Leisingera sp. ANG-M1]|uniref:rhomboid family intramembrane serine protease n=1 Tax=Leisingera sp. ANG-M1 TaxID=1577895 RepID=UPI00057F5C1B|nr:rhomboid family intramembrane serine protease [Leisingera sp. ANG-M1]KIC12899.1 peptidase C54 [Leisingera sp. ANG-M1]
MFPIRDHNPSGRTPYVVYALMAVNILAYIYYTASFASPRALAVFYDTYAVVPAEISHGYGFETLFTSMFIHAGLMHLGGNMLFLWIFGDNLEDEMGHLPFLLFYLASGIGAGLIHVLSAPGSWVPTVGASGAIAGVMGGYLLMFPKARVDILLVLIIYFRIFTIPAFIMLGLWLAMQFFGGLGSDPDQGGVAYWAHAGGFAVGLVLCLPLWLRRGGPAFWNKTHGQPPHPENEYEYSASRIPKLPRKKPRPGPWGK